MSTEEEVKAPEALPIGYADDTQIAAWKTQYRTRHIPELICVEADGTQHAAYLKQPEISHLQMLNEKVNTGQEVDAMVTLLNTLFIGGSEHIKEDYWLKMECIAGLEAVMQTKAATVKKR